MADGWEELDKMFENLLKRFPEKKKELMEDVAQEMYLQVLTNIAETVEPKTGNLGKGVKKVIGSNGGYAAVKPDYSIAPHSHLIEDGHRIIRNGKVVGWANGKHMYRNALDQVADDIEGMAQDMINELVGEVDE